jgi:nucleoside-diphosphate-sugar epimerase
MVRAWSWVHIEDAAAATAAALECRPGAYNIVDADPAPLAITEEEAFAAFGPDTVYYATRLRGASNEKAKHELNFQPRPLEWRHPSQLGP